MAYDIAVDDLFEQSSYTSLLHTCTSSESNDKNGYKSNSKEVISNSNIEMWKQFSSHLNHVLDIYMFRSVGTLIDEFIKLETYVSKELELDENKENDLYFRNQSQIVNYLNKTIKVRFCSFFTFPQNN